MSVVIVGGHERMVCQYKEICIKHECKVKVFVKEKCSLKTKLGSPDLIIILMSTVSHAMAAVAIEGAKRNGADIARIQSSSASALNKFLIEYCALKVSNYQFQTISHS